MKTKLWIALVILVALGLALVLPGFMWDGVAFAQYYDGGVGETYCAPSQAGTQLADGSWCGYFCGSWYSDPPHICMAALGFLLLPLLRFTKVSGGFFTGPTDD